VEELLAEDERVAAGIHLLEQAVDERDGGAGVGLHGVEEVLKPILGQEADILGEHAEEAAREEGGDELGWVFLLFEGFGEFGEVAGDLAGDGGGFFGRIERVRVEPDGAEALAHLGLAEVVQAEAVRARVGEVEVGFSLLGEVGEELEGVADIDDEQERRGLFGDGQGVGVALGLAAGLDHLAIPGFGAAGDAGAAGGVGLEGKLGLLDGGGGVLFGLEDEAAAAVEVDAAGGGAAVGVVERHGALEDVGVGLGVGAGGIGARHLQHVAQLGEEELVVGAFGSLRAGPTLDKGVEGRGNGLGHGARDCTRNVREGKRENLRAGGAPGRRRGGGRARRQGGGGCSR